jgi:hypothetical protein
MTRRIVLRVSLSTEDDADEIERTLAAETRRAVDDMAVLRAAPPPVVRTHDDRDRLRFTVTCTIGRMIDADHAHRELAKRLRARLRALGVDTRRVVIECGLAWQEPATRAAAGESVVGERG